MAHFVDPLLVTDFFEGVHGTGLHIVLEPERVADFVGDDVFQQAAHQVVREGQFLGSRIERAHLDEVPVPGQVHDVVIELDVGVEDLAGAGVADVRPAGVLGGGGQPANDGITDVFRAPLGILRGGGRFLADDGVLEAGGGEGLVPVFNSLLEPGHPLSGRSGIDVVDDGLDGLGDGGRGILLFEPPAGDVARAFGLVLGA